MGLSLKRKQGSAYLPVQAAAFLLLRGSLYSFCDLCMHAVVHKCSHVRSRWGFIAVASLAISRSYVVVYGLIFLK